MMSFLTRVPPPVWLPVVALALLFWGSLRRFPGDWLHPGRLIVGFYFLVSLSSLTFEQVIASSGSSSVTWGRMVGYTLLICLTLVPAFFLERPDARRVVGHGIIRPLLLWSVPLVLFATVYLAPHALDSFRRGFAATRYALNVAKVQLLPGGILTTLAVAAASYYVLFTLLFFAALIRRMGTFAVVVSALGVCLPVVHAAVFGARDGVIWVVQSLLLGLWVVGAALTPVARRRATFTIALLCVAGLAYFALATKDRFAESEGGYASGTVGYFGSQPYVFSETVERLATFYGTGNRFPLVAGLLGEKAPKRSEAFEWSFGTFLTDFYGVAGWGSALGLSLLLTLATLGALALCRRRSALAHALVVAAYTQFMVQGVFYFRLGNRAGNLYHLSLFLLILTILALFPDRTAEEDRPEGAGLRRPRFQRRGARPPLP